MADLFLFCYESDIMMSLFEGKQSKVIEFFSSTSRYLISQMYPSELQLNKANSSEIETLFLDLHLSISDGFSTCKLYDKRDDFDFEIVNFPNLDWDVPRRASYGVYYS